MITTNTTNIEKSSIKSVRFTDRFVKAVGSRTHGNAVESRAANAEESLFLARMLSKAVGAVANDQALQQVLMHNPQTIRVLQKTLHREVSFFAYLPLNPTGYRALQYGQFDRRQPNINMLAAVGEAPAAIYIWCIYAPGALIPAISAMAAHFEEIAPTSIPVFTSAATAHSARLFESLGFARARDHFPDVDGDVLVVFRPAAQTLQNAANRAPPINADVAEPAASPRTTTRISRTIEDVMKVFSIRAATYMNEQRCPYDEEFDGNDFCAAHILGEVNGEPAGCIRIRFFGDFVKIERLAVRPEFRSSTLAFRLVRAALDYCRAKGFRKAYGHARHDLVNFWARFGFRAISGRPTFEFSDVTYVEMEAEVAASDDVIGIGRSPFELIRPEGLWDRPGPLDRSAARGSAGASLPRRVAIG